MADAITIKALQDASLDAKSLEEVVNGNESKQVTTRKGETYPSVKKAIKTMFENGGLPATPFATKALMTASALADGKYAMVTDDTVNNGLYLKTAGAWVKSGYDPLTQANAYITPQQTSFVRGGGGINLFDGKFYSLHMSGNPPHEVISGSGISAIVKLEPGTQYTFSKSPDADRFRFGFFDEFPVAGAVPVATAYATGLDGGDSLSSYTHVARDNERYAVVALSGTKVNHEPAQFQVEVGDSPTEYISPKKLGIDLSKNSIPLIEPEMTNFFEKGRNLFDGEYLSGALDGNPPYGLMTDKGGLYAVIPVSAETTYTISKSPDTNRFRFGCFAEFPQTGSVPTSYYKADNDVITLTDEFTLTTDSDTAYLVVVPTSTTMSQAPEWMQVEVGAESTPYSRPFTIKSGLLPTMETAQRKRVDVVIAGDFDAPYVPITAAPVMDSSLNIAMVYAWFDDLVARFPDLWSRSLLATETSGMPVYRYDFKPPVTRGILSESLPKILHVNGIHGNEKQALAAGMRFYKDLTDNWQSSALLEIFRWNVHFVVIPAFNAYGVENDTRGNANGVNLNRNFPNNWRFSSVAYDSSGSEPLSEPESAALMELLETEKNIIFAIDHHNYNPYSSYTSKDAFTIWTGTKNTSVNKYLSGWSRTAQGMFVKKHPELAVGNLSRIKIEEAYAMGSTGWLGPSFIDKGIAGTIFEISKDSHLSDFHTSALGGLFGFALKELHADKSKWFK